MKETTPETIIDLSTEPSEDDGIKVKPPELKFFAPSVDDSDLPPTPGRVVRVFSHVHSKPACDDSTDEMLAIMGAVDGQEDYDQNNSQVNPSIHRLLMNPETMSFRHFSSHTDHDDSLEHKDINAPQFIKIRVAAHAYHTFVPTVGIGLNAAKKNEAKVMIHTKTEFWFAFPSERQVIKLHVPYIAVVVVIV